MELGTVVITGASGQVGQALLSSLQGKCQSLIALVRQPVKIPANEIIADWINSPKAHEAIAQADFVVHLAGSLKPDRGDYISANVKPTEVVASALNKSQVKRLVFLSYVGASQDSLNAYLSTKAQAESILQVSGLPLTIFRCTHIIGSPTKPGPTAKNLLSKNGKAVAVLGSGHQKVAPVYIENVVSAIISALRRERDGVFDLAGLERLSMNDLVKLLNHKETVKVNHLPLLIAKLLPWVVQDLPAALVDVMLSDSLADPKSAIEAFDLKLTPLREVWMAV